MVLGGLQKNSFIDYPGKVSAVLFLSGCNFKCPYCHNPELVAGASDCPAFINENWVLDFLEKRKGFLDGVVISGGEPTLHGDLSEFCDKLKNLGFPIKVDTNGSRPRVIQNLIKRGLVDYVAMDIKTDPDAYSPLLKSTFDPDDLLESVRIVMESGVDYEFRTTCIKPLVDEKVIRRISKLIEGSPLYALQRFRDDKVLRPDFFRCGASGFHGAGLSDPELARLRSIASSFVGSCIVR